jgi:uncharacterized membrane protein (DUF4010 family)
MSETDAFVRFGVALIVGFGIGVERGFKQRDVPEGRRAVGVRTIAFIALIGAGGGMSAAFAGPWLLAAVAAGVVAFLIAGYRAGLSVSPDLGLTTEMAAIATFMAGALSGAGFLLAAASTGAASILLLHNKRALHRLTDRIEAREIEAAVKVLAIAALLVPLSPDPGFGPRGVLNLRELAIAVVLLSSLGLAGYAAMRIIGGRGGLLAFGVAGGLVSSTGVTLAASKMARNAPGHAEPFAAATALAQSIMFVRTGALAGALNPAMLQALFWPLAAGALASALAAWRFSGSGRPHAVPLSLGSPDTLNASARFVAVAAAVSMVAALLMDGFGIAGLYVSGAVAGLVDVDAATVMAARLTDTTFGGAFAAILALAANSCSKTAIAWRAGGRDMGMNAGFAFLGSGLAAAVTFVAVLLAA